MQAAMFLTVSVLFTATADTSQMNVNTEQLLNAACGANVTLPCSFDNNVTLTDFYWTDGKKTLCEKKTLDRETSNIHCVYEKSLGQVTLTIEDVQPKDSSSYYCKLFGSSGHGMNLTVLTISECKISSGKFQSFNAPLNHAWASGSKWISMVISVTVLLSPILD